ncbi:hypothetical protein ACF0H5_005589 [Mactra antiquata]
MADKENIDDSFVPNKSSVKQLKQFLREHIVPISGVKELLVKRAEGILSLGLVSREKLSEDDCKQASDRKTERFLTPLGENLPTPCSLKSGWTGDIECFPPFSD